MILLDSQVWIWFHTGHPRLGEDGAGEIEEARESILLSTVTLWETMFALQRGRLVSPFSPEETVRLWLKASPFTVIPLGQEEAILSRTLPFAHEDPADRFIAATAMARGAKLMTSDARLLTLDWLPTIRI